jgi:uroporphyrinogen-III synthase
MSLDTRPLQGRRIAITRPAGTGAELARALERLGAVPFVAPLIEVRPAPNGRALEASIAWGAGRYDWIVFTSANAVRAVAPLLQRRSSRRGKIARVAAVGSATARALASRGIRVDFVPSTFEGKRLAAELDVRRGDRLLLPRSAIAEPALPEALRARGARVDQVAAYDVRQGPGAARLRAALSAGTIDFLTLYSPSAARTLATVALGLSLPPIVAVGPVTARAAVDAGMPAPAVAARSDDDGVIATLLQLARVQ